MISISNYSSIPVLPMNTVSLPKLIANHSLIAIYITSFDVYLVLSKHRIVCSQHFAIGFGFSFFFCLAKSNPLMHSNDDKSDSNICIESIPNYPDIIRSCVNSRSVKTFWQKHLNKQNYKFWDSSNNSIKVAKCVEKIRTVFRLILVLLRLSTEWRLLFLSKS